MARCYAPPVGFGMFGISPNFTYFHLFSPFFTHSLLIFAACSPFQVDFSPLWGPSFCC